MSILSTGASTAVRKARGMPRIQAGDNTHRQAPGDTWSYGLIKP